MGRKKKYHIVVNPTIRKQMARQKRKRKLQKPKDRSRQR